MGCHWVSDEGGGGITGFLCVGRVGEDVPLAGHPLVYLRLISAVSYLQDQPCASPSHFEALQVSILQICVASLSWMAARLCSGNDPYSWKNPTMWGRHPPWDDFHYLPHSPPCWCTGAKGALDGANGLTNYSPLFLSREFVEGLRQSIYISWRKRNWKH